MSDSLFESASLGAREDAREDGAGLAGMADATAAAVAGLRVPLPLPPPGGAGCRLDEPPENPPRVEPARADGDAAVGGVEAAGGAAAGREPPRGLVWSLQNVTRAVWPRVQRARSSAGDSATAEGGRRALASWHCQEAIQSRYSSFVRLWRSA